MKAKYDKIGIDYDLTRKADPYLMERMLYHLQPTVEGVYLDIGCGSGNYTHEFQQYGGQYIGIDPSMTMLDKAKKRNTTIDWRIGTAEETGLDTESVHGMTTFLTLHHWPDIHKGIAALASVLKHKGRMVIFTSTPKQMKQYWLCHYFPKMLADSIAQMPSLASITKALNNADLEIITTDPYSIHPDLQDHFLYCGKHNPAIYFKPQIRNGISSFSALAHTEEVIQGLANLRKDIDSGGIHRVMKSYENDLGDYVFIVGEKNCL